MQGGSPCENATNLRLETYNVEIAAMMAPRPMLIVSAPEQRRVMTGTTERHRETFQRALKLPVKIAFGTDLSGNHERAGQEFVWMVRYGMAPLEALRSATSVAAELMGWQSRVAWSR